MEVVGGWISGADARSLIVGIGVLCGAVTAIVVLFRQPLIARPIGWLGRTLIADPMTKVIHRALDEWAAKVWEPRIEQIERKVDEVRDQFRNNGGSTMRDRVDAVAEATGANPAPDR